MSDHPPMRSVHLPGWIRSSPDATAGVMSTHRALMPNEWAALFVPPVWWAKEHEVEPKAYLWRPTDQDMPVPDNPGLWITDDPIVKVAVGMSPSHFTLVRSQCMAFRRVIDESIAAACSSSPLTTEGRDQTIAALKWVAQTFDRNVRAFLE